MMNCRINLKTSEALQNANQVLNDSKMGELFSTADWLAFNFVFRVSRTTTKSSKCTFF